jgi:hypothetical protein
MLVFTLSISLNLVVYIHRLSKQENPVGHRYDFASCFVMIHLGRTPLLLVLGSTSAVQSRAVVAKIIKCAGVMAATISTVKCKINAKDEKHV